MTVFIKNIKKTQSGIALVMVMIVLFAVMFSVLVVSSIIAGEVKMSNNVVNSIASYYVAESGIEKGLYYLKVSRENSDFSYFTDLGGSSTTMSHGGSYLIATSSTSAPDFTVQDIPTTAPVYVDIISPPGNVNNIDWSSSSVDTYQVDWEILNCFPTYSSKRLQITINSFENNFSNPTAETHLISCGCTGSDVCASYNGPVAANKYYRFTFKPIDVKVKKINFSVNNGSEGIPSESIIETYGTYKSSQYYMKAQLPVFGSTYDIFQYIIFSEENLSK